MIVDLGADHNSVEELSAREDDRKVRSEGRRSIASLVLVDSHLDFLLHLQVREIRRLCGIQSTFYDRL
jgi:hypothetical protein